MTILQNKGLFKRALIWLICLGILFFSSYSFTNWLASIRNDVGSIVFDWEQYIPLWPWTIVPYWSIDFLYGFAFLLVTNQKELDTLGRRLLTAQLICISCFLLFPLRFSFERPPQSGFFGLWFDLLMGFDKPFNQAPSLHITLLVILWAFYTHHISSKWQWLLHTWFLLIGVSVLTTWQHHFFDIPTGVLVGCLCIWVWPMQGYSPLAIKKPPKIGKWSILYLVGFFICSLLALLIKGWGLWLFWPAIAFLLVAVNYLLVDAIGFQKQPNGRFSIAVNLLYYPYMLIMWINSRLWTHHNNEFDFVIDNIYLGRIPSKNTLSKHSFDSIIDLCSELPIPKNHQGYYSYLPVLDMTPLSVALCHQVALKIQKATSHGKVLICCGLGYSRSATAIIAWLLWTNRVSTIDQAIAQVKQARPSIVISSKQQIILEKWLMSFRIK